MTAPRVTVLVPTSGDRGPLLEHSVGSALNQTVQDIEVLIVGDGADAVTRDAALALERKDGRVRFLDHPKSERRGELYRHAALANARGAAVCYLCDRDLWMPSHLAVMLNLLADHDLATTLALDPGTVSRSHQDEFQPALRGLWDPGNAADRSAIQRYKLGFQLSCAGHTLRAYRALPYGWRTTPATLYTDRYMWGQFLSQSWCQPVIRHEATVLYFKRGDHPGWSTERRLEELRHWSSKLNDANAINSVLASAGLRLVADAVVGRRAWREPVLLFGSAPGQFVGRAVRSIKRALHWD